MRVAVRVTAAGLPVAGATVQLSEGRGASRTTAITDRDGRAVISDLDPGAYELWAESGELASPVVRTARPGAADTELALALAPAATVEGQVTGGTARAVRLIPIDVDHAVRWLDLDATGRFAVGALPPGRWLVEVDAPGYLVADGVVIDAVAGRPASLALPLVRAGVIAGRVVDATGAPVAGATLVLRGGPATGSVSRAWLDPALSSASARWIHPLAGSRQLPIRDSRRFGAARDGARPAECGHGHCGVDIGVARGSVVHAATDGVIWFVAAQPRGKAGRYVAIDHPGGLRSFYMHLDQVRDDLAPGQPVAAGEPIGTLGATGVIRSGPHLHFALSQDSAGRSWFVDPEPLLRYAVVLPEARSLDAGAAVASFSRSGAPGLPSPTRFVTDADGRFRIDGVAPGDYAVAAFAAELAPGTSARFALGSGAEVDGVTVALVPGVVVAGEVLGSAGPVAGAQVSAIEGSGETARTVARAVTDAGGRFQLRPLAGNVAISITARGHQPAWRELALDRGPPRRRESFVLEPEAPVLPAAEAGRVRFVLRDRHTLDRLGGVAIAARGPDGARARAVTRGDGAVELAGLSPGRWTLRARRAGYVAVEHTIDVAAGERLDIPPLELARGATLRGVVRDDSGNRVDGARVTAGDATAVTDRAGEFELADAPTGRVEIRAELDGRWGAIQLELRPGDELVTLQIDIE